MNIQHEIEGLLSDISILQSENRRLTDRVHRLEVKVGNTTIYSLQNRITKLQEDIAKLNNRISALETKKEVVD